MLNKRNLILGAFAGDIIGSSYEFRPVKSTDFKFWRAGTYFTDDSVMTAATMDAIINKRPYAEAYQDFGQRFPHRGYGENFRKWLNEPEPQPYNSYGNGSAMRVSPVGWAFETLDEVLEEAKKSAEVSHNHPEGIKGAQAVASAVYLARIGKNKREIEKYITDTFHYNLRRTIEDIRPDYLFEVSCQKSVPEAIIAFLESDSFEEAVRLAVSLGGDSDTIACMTGAIAEAFYMEVPSKILKNVSIILGPDLMKDVIMPFSAKYGFIV
jgi:ADP-ribosylglycohydrolase